MPKFRVYFREIINCNQIVEAESIEEVEELFGKGGDEELNPSTENKTYREDDREFHYLDDVEEVDDEAN